VELKGIQGKIEDLKKGIWAAAPKPGAGRKTKKDLIVEEVLSADQSLRSKLIDVMEKAGVLKRAGMTKEELIRLVQERQA